ncbi:hypothetical protein LY90DRAFT_505019 [Neocallimastix californiae]|uniref:Uncharacterized protein n=1 Tax=Neocallimastix californiae TaxID=1754190 RepID=A0A1Y2DZN9_9FUNG|nr:hypothetical protein LY90DRAFT_505019 [Neocallimastix californiae]|eukprot:ORY64689.1 hypothetical protein LY90DRAFT_505019 [Neocallimastix californiae]
MYIKDYLSEQSFDYVLEQTLFKRADKETNSKKTTPKNDPEPQPAVVTTKKKKTTTKKEIEQVPEPTPEPVIIPGQPVAIPTVTSEPTPTTKTKNKHKTKTTSILPTSVQTTSSNDGVSFLIDEGRATSNNTSFYIGVFLGIIGFVVAVGLFIVGTQKYSKKKNYQTHLTRKVQNSRMSLLPTPNGNLNPSPLLRPGSIGDKRTSFSPTTYVGGQTLSPPNVYGYDANASFNSAITENSSYYSNTSFTQAYPTNAATINTSPINTSPIYSGDYQAQTAVNQDNYMEYQLPYSNYPAYDYSYNYGYNNNLSPVDGTAGVAYTVDASNKSIVSSVNMATQTTPPLGEDKAQTTSQDKDDVAATPGIVVSPPTEATNNAQQQQSQQQEFLDAPPPPKRRESKLVYYTNGSSPLLAENLNNGYSLEIPSIIESNNNKEVVVDQQNIASSEETVAPVISITPPKEDTNTVEEAKVEVPKIEEAKVEEPKVEESKVEESKVEESKVEEPKVEEPKIEESKVEEPKVEEPKIEESKIEESKVEESKVEESKTEESKVEESKVEESKTEEVKNKNFNVRTE